ncbi:MAG: DUF499 domain-containing protein, partial [Polyangiaceae bacterium]|nr:DUF499 domain-containing protein [Polyangiaceae bacterium]
MEPWYRLVIPRVDLRSGKPLDASEFAVHLGHVRDGRAPSVYQDPVEFFDRTYVTSHLRNLSSQVVRRLSGVRVETSAVFNLSTQFGGGKSHALALLFHLARGGADSAMWSGVIDIVRDAGVDRVPEAAIAVFVGTEFDSIAGRGGEDGTPVRKTPWGEVAYQIGGIEAYRCVQEHENLCTAPGGDVIERILPRDRPVLLLFDELMNYSNRTRSSGLSSQLHSFLHNLTEVVRARDNAVIAVSVPGSELEMTSEDHSDFNRFRKLLDRVGKAMIMSAEGESAEIIRRRLFEWRGLPSGALETIDEYAKWLQLNKQRIPTWFPVDDAAKVLAGTYPFHPCVLSVFERKWQGLPQFQQTRGVLRLLAMWVSIAYTREHQKAYADPLISLGSAPLDDPQFRAAVFEQLGEVKLEPAVTTDISGNEHAHAMRLDAGAAVHVREARLHRKVATTIFFESNGGQVSGVATHPEVRLAVGEPDLDLGSAERCLEALTEKCYYLAVENNRYWFSFRPNLNKLLADRRASILQKDVDERVREEVRRVFSKGPATIDRLYFPSRSYEIPDRPVLVLVVADPDDSARMPYARDRMHRMTTECGASSRTFKTALIWIVAEDTAKLEDEARKCLAWKGIADEAELLGLDKSQLKQLAEHRKRAERDVGEAVWLAYKNLYVLGEGNVMRYNDLGLVHSSAAPTMTDLILWTLRREESIVEELSPSFLCRHWPPALPEWSTQSVRDACFASPRFPRLLNGESVKNTISRGLADGSLA